MCVCVQAAWEKSKTTREERREKLLEYTRRQGKAYTFQAPPAAPGPSRTRTMKRCS